MQSLIYATVEDPTTQQRSENVGLVQPLESPFNLFLNLNQLRDPYTENVSFFIYSIGARKIIMWGVWNKSTEQFTIDSGCRYRGPQLYGITMYWIKNGYSYVGNTVRNRPQEIVSEQLHGPRVQNEEYIRKRYLLAYLLGEIDEYQYSNKFGQLPPLPDDDYDRLELATDLQVELKKYERGPRQIESTDDGLFPEFSRSQMMSYPEYVQAKTLLAYLQGRITAQQYRSQYGFLPLEEVDREQLEDRVRQYERSINRLDLPQNLPSDLVTQVKYITDRFAYTVSRGNFNDESLDSCPSLDECNVTPNETCNVYWHTVQDFR